MKNADKFLAVVQTSFESILWAGSDAEAVLKFAEESVCGGFDLRTTLELLREDDPDLPLGDYAISKMLDVRQEVAKRSLIYSTFPAPVATLTRLQAIACIGKVGVRVEDVTGNVCGLAADVFPLHEIEPEQMSSVRSMSHFFEGVRTE